MALFIWTINMAKIDLFPGESFPIGSGLSARQSRNGTIISNTSLRPPELKKPPVVASQLAVVKECLNDARRLWNSWTPEMQGIWSNLARQYSTPRFPAKSGLFSDFNLFFSQYSAFWYGNYYNNGDLTYFDGTTWRPFYHNAFVEPEPSRVYEPKPEIIGNYFYKSTSFAIQDAPILDYTNKKFYFRINYTFPSGTPTFFRWWFIFFNWNITQGGFIFYISNPGMEGGLSFARNNRLLIATYKPNSVATTGMSLYPGTFVDFRGPLAKYSDLSVLELQAGKKVKITAFLVSSYGQCLNLGDFTSEII